MHVPEVLEPKLSLRTKELRIRVRLHRVTDAEADIAVPMKHRASEHVVRRELLSEVGVRAGIDLFDALVGGVASPSTNAATIRVIREWVSRRHLVGRWNVQGVFTTEALQNHGGGSTNLTV